MRSMLLLLLLAVAPQPGLPYSNTAKAVTDDAPNYTSDGQLKMPEHYREWIFLSSGVDMSYSPSAATARHSTFDNVFVNRSFLQTGTWPDKTTLVLEIRGAEGPSSINKSEHSQSPEIMGMEIHVKDAKLDVGWGFFEFDNPSARQTATSATKTTSPWIQPSSSSVQHFSVSPKQRAP